MIFRYFVTKSRKQIEYILHQGVYKGCDEDIQICEHSTNEEELFEGIKPHIKIT